MSEALPRGPFTGQDQESRLKRARNEAEWLWHYWTNNVLILADEDDRDKIEVTFENLLKALEEE